MLNRVFVSHAAADSHIVEESIIPVLRSHGLSPWYASSEIHPATNWETEIQAALRDCQFLLVVLSENALESTWVKAEISWWVDKRLSSQYPLIPLVIDKCDWQSIHLVLRTIQAVDWSRESYAERRIALLSQAFGRSWCPQLAVERYADVCRLPSAALAIQSYSAKDPSEVVKCAVCAEGVWSPNHGFSTVSDLAGEDLTGDVISLAISGRWGGLSALLLSSGSIITSFRYEPHKALIRETLPPNPSAGALLQKGQIAAGYTDGSIYVFDEGTTRCVAKPEGDAIIGLAPSPQTRMIAASESGRIQSWLIDDYSEVKSIKLPEMVTAFANDSDREEGIVLGFDTGFIEKLDWDLTSRHRLFHSSAPVDGLYVLRNNGLASVSGNSLKEWATYPDYPLSYEWICGSLEPDNLAVFTVTYEDRSKSIWEVSRYVVTAGRSGYVQVQLISDKPTYKQYPAVI